MTTPGWTLPLTPRQLQFALLYAHGMGDRAIALEVHTTLANVTNTLHRVKVKYRNAGFQVHTKADVRERLIADGLLTVTPTGAKTRKTRRPRPGEPAWKSTYQ
jgi:hypothetical protein